MGKFGGFSKVKLTKPQKSTFDLSHERRMSVAPSYLVPVLVTECVPSDKFNGSSEVLARLAPLLAPIYEQVMIYVHYFFVPNRLLWEDWEEFITGGRLGASVDPAEAPIPPYFIVANAAAIDANMWEKGSLADYLGCPIFSEIAAINTFNVKINALPFLAYECIYQNYYLDRNFSTLEEDIPLPQGSGDRTGFVGGGGGRIRQRMYMKDYFTSALAFTQRGEEVLLPVELSGYAPVVGTVSSSPSGIDRWELQATQQPGGGSVNRVVPEDENAPYNSGINAPELFANLSAIEDQGYASSINDFRSAYALQVWLERNAIGGSRYTESTQAHFGVRPQDARLQRPEYIGGGRINVKISEVVSTAYSQNDVDNTVPLANLAGHGVSFGNTNKFSYFCTEHGFIMGLLSIMVPPSYHQGLPRMFLRESFLDYPWPTFAKLGEQQVDKSELYASVANLTKDADGERPLFGYQSRYADWKYIPSTNHGDFHDTLLFWTGTLDFDASPELGETFLTPNVETFNRWFAVNGDSRNFWLYVHNRLFVSRPLPYFGTPNTLGFV